MVNTLKLDQNQIRKTENELYSVFDAIELIAQKKNQRLVWKRLAEQYPDVVTKVTSFTFPRNKGRSTPVTDKQTIIEIITLLPGKVGGDTRKAAVELLLKYIEAPEELGRLMVLQGMQCCGLKKADAKGHSEISTVIQLAANDFQAMLEKFGVV